MEVDSYFCDSGVIVTPVKTGSISILLTWIPFSNGMTDAPVTWMPAEVYPRASKGRHDELSFCLRARDFKVETGRV